MVGLYYFEENANHAEFGTIDQPRTYLSDTGIIPGPQFPIQVLSLATTRYVTADAKSKAIYAQVTWHFTDAWSLTLGGRYTKDDRSATRFLDQTGAAFVPTGQIATPRSWWAFPSTSAIQPRILVQQQPELQQVQPGRHDRLVNHAGRQHVPAHRHRLQGRRFE